MTDQPHNGFDKDDPNQPAPHQPAPIQPAYAPLPDSYAAGQPPPPPPYAAVQPGNGLAIAGFVLSIVAAVFFWVPFFNAICWILGLVFSSIGLSRANKQGLPHRGLAIAGLSISLGGFVLLVLGFTLILIAAS